MVYTPIKNKVPDLFKRKPSDVFAVAIILLTILTPAMAADYEKPPSLPAAEVYPGIPLKGEHYTIDPSVPTDGFLTRAVIKSEFGDFVAVGPGVLETRLHEIDALVKLQTFEASEEFQRGAKDSANEKWESLKQMVDQPKEAAAGLSAGVSRLMMWSMIESRVAQMEGEQTCPGKPRLRLCLKAIVNMKKRQRPPVAPRSICSALITHAVS